LTRSGNVPDFSDEDQTFVDIAAPGVGIFSTFPKQLTASQDGCTPQGYTDCAAGDYHKPEGTSFAAPQVAAAAAVLFGIDPALTSSQVTKILERHADDVDAATGCSECPTGRDVFSGWGSLDVTNAVDFLDSESPLPPSDRLEPNDDSAQAPKLWGKQPSFGATLDYWDDPVDIYRVQLKQGQQLKARAAAHWANAYVDLSVWRPGTSAVAHGHKGQVAATAEPASTQHLSYRAPSAGWYYVALRVTQHGGGRYTLRLAKTR
jgi:subtilisin family serine protease